MGDEGVGRNLRMYYFSNDQRRHLFDNIEDIDIHRVEFIVPFFDSVLIKLMASIPINLGLRHEFYMDVVGEFPAVVSSVPWQAYPNHEPCPIPIPHGLLYQWDQSSPENMSARKEARETILRVVGGRRFPSLYSRPRMFVLAVLEYFKLSRRSYVFQPFLSLARAIDVENKK